MLGSKIWVSRRIKSVRSQVLGLKVYATTAQPWKLFLKKIYCFINMKFLLTCMYVCNICLVPVEFRNVRLIPLELELEMFCELPCGVLWLEFRFSERKSTLNIWAVSPIVQHHWWIQFLFLCVYSMCMGTCRSQKQESDSLKLELQMNVSFLT